MTICSQCNQNVPDDANFCVSCGAPLIKETAQSFDSSDPTDDEFDDLQTISDLQTDPSGILTKPPRENGNTSHLKPGDVIADKFVVEHVLGRGGMGVVYRAVERVTNQVVAVKVIHNENAANKKAIARLIEEGIATREISHPNIVRIFDIGLDGDRPYIAMEYIEGKPLHVWRGQMVAKNETVSIALVSEIIVEVLDGLEAAHAVGIIHRDLKPENIMLVGDPEKENVKLKIVDFGIALATKSQVQSSTGTGLGTQLYMAPEQIRNANAANESADLYSLSKIYYELIVGVLPTGHWQPPSDGRSDVPVGIDRLIERGLSLNRDLRPQNAAQYRQLIKTAGSSQKGGRKADREAENLKKSYIDFIKTRPVWFWIIIAIILIGLFFDSFLSEDIFYDEESDWPEYTEKVDKKDLVHEALLEEIFDKDPEQDDQAVEEKKTVKPEPVIPKPSRNYFTGRWFDGLGGSYSVTAEDNGSFRGNGNLADGSYALLSGKISQHQVQFSVTVNGIAVGGGTSARTDKCHFSYQVQNPYTGFPETQVFHMNHQPGAPCPS